MNDPVQRTVQIQAVLNEYKHLTAKTFNVDDVKAVDLLETIKALCNDAAELHLERVRLQNQR